MLRINAVLPFSFLELINAILQIILFLARFTSFNTRWKVQMWNHKSLLRVLHLSLLSMQYYIYLQTKRQNKTFEKVLYLKTLLIEKESTSAPGRFLKAERVVLQRLFTENRTRNILLFSKYTVSKTSNMG